MDLPDKIRKQQEDLWNLLQISARSRLWQMKFNTLIELDRKIRLLQQKHFQLAGEIEHRLKTIVHKRPKTDELSRTFHQERLNLLKAITKSHETWQCTFDEEQEVKLNGLTEKEFWRSIERLYRLEPELRQEFQGFTYMYETRLLIITHLEDVSDEEFMKRLEIIMHRAPGKDKVKTIMKAMDKALRENDDEERDL